MRVKRICKILSSLFILSIPMQPLFTIVGFNILAFLACFMMLLIILIDKKVSFTKFEKTEILFIILMILSLMMGDHLIEKIKYVFSIVRYIIFIFFSIRLAEYSMKDDENYNVHKLIDRILGLFTVGTILISIYCLISEPSNNGYYGRMGRFLFDNGYGGYISYSYDLIISVLWLIYKILDKNNKNRKIYILGLCILLPCMMLNGTKKNIIAMIVFFVLYCIFNAKNPLDAFLKVLILGIGIVFLYNFIISNDYLYSVIGYRIELYVKSIVNDDIETFDNSTRDRTLMRKEATQYFKESPIYGNGISSFMYKFGDKYGIYLYSHNNYLEILCDLGIIGFIIYYSWFLRSVIFLIKRILSKKDYLEIFMLSFLITELVLDYGTVSFDKIHYLLIFDLISFYIMFSLDRREKIYEK